MKIEFNDAKYRFALGKAPRGYGYWRFMIDNQEEYCTVCTLTEAKKNVCAYIRSNMSKDHVGAVRVEIES